FGQRANFEEAYQGESLQGSYVAGVYYPDKTRVGWWKNGYPEYFAKVLNSVNWIGLDISLNGQFLDLSAMTPSNFKWGLDMQKGILYRSFELELKPGQRVRIATERFCSMADDQTAALQFAITAVQGPMDIGVISYLDANVTNHDANWEETFWEQLDCEADAERCLVTSKTKKTNYIVGAAACLKLSKATSLNPHFKKGYASQGAEVSIEEGETLTFVKYVGLVSSMDYASEEVARAAEDAMGRAQSNGYDLMKQAHIDAWKDIWKLADISIQGDEGAQQAIRFNIFHLNQTYTGADSRLNIGPKGFTGEKYGGSTYWDTEAYCLPFYLNTKGDDVARQLLVYRYNHLKKAIENAAKLGFTNGAALYPMVTMNGEECHNEWEITFEEIHRNGAIAFAIFNYVRHTGDQSYLSEFGWDVLLGIARFWCQRVNWSTDKEAFVMLGVTGPNEYENNVNNNWYTNYIAAWCMRYAGEVYEYLQSTAPKELEEKVRRYSFMESELKEWQERVEKMYYPMIEGTNICLQQDGFLDKEMIKAADLPDDQRPINQHWSWDRILRSVFIKQADVLQGFYFFEDEFDIEDLRANFDYYEPITVHESSLSPCVHAIQAAKLGKKEKAYEMYLRTARLDLDDYNHEVHEGLHITSMAGTWMAVVEGFGGFRVRDDQLHFNASLPEEWESFDFTINFRGRRLKVVVSGSGTEVSLLEGEPLEVFVLGQPTTVN
ncbi:MAG: glycoside hydrolase family 65 protein, partial [Flavobacteriales bacterium]|nr:glycoside hydrolase family 65 protein [Flavobacteriales bacterium]